MSNVVFRLLANGSGPGGRALFTETSLDVSSSLISGGKRPLAVTIEYCLRLGVIDSSLETSEDNLMGVVAVPMVGVVGTGCGPLNDGIVLGNFLGLPRPLFSPVRGVTNCMSPGEVFNESCRLFFGLPRGL